jgi:hypothetical protein
MENCNATTETRQATDRIPVWRQYTVHSEQV